VAVRDIVSGDFLVVRYKLPEVSMYNLYSIGLQGCILEGERPHDAVYRLLSDDMGIKENDTILPRFHGFLTASDSLYERVCLVLFHMIYTVSNHFQSNDKARIISKWMPDDRVGKLYDGGFLDSWSSAVYPHLIQHCTYEHVKADNAMLGENVPTLSML
jgi:predicted NUDIX family phosphoesterase